MQTETSLIEQFVAAQRDGSRPIDATALADLDRAAAYRIQAGTREALGETIGMIKAGIYADGGAAAPIYGSRVSQASGFTLPAARTIGLEVEIGIVLGRDVPAGASEDEIAAAVDHYFTGVEIIGTRYIDRGKAGPNAGLANNMSALGYVVGPRRARGVHIDGARVELALGGKSIWSAPAFVAGNRTVLASVVAYAAAQNAQMPLKAGLTVTTGSLCGMVDTGGAAGHVVAMLGTETVELDLV